MVNITGHQENEYQHQIISLHTQEDGNNNNNNRKNKCWLVLYKDVEKLEPSYVAGRNKKWHNHCGKIVWQLLKNDTEFMYYPVTPPFLDINPKELKTGVQTKTGTQIFIAGPLIIVKKVETT